MKAVNILWDVDVCDILDSLDNMYPSDGAKTLNLQPEVYEKMTDAVLEDYIQDLLDNDQLDLNKIMNLPDEIEIPENITDMDEISDYLSDQTGYCHKGFDILEKQKFEVPVSYQLCGTVKVEAYTLDEALEYAKENINELPLPENPGYVEGSYQVDEGWYF